MGERDRLQELGTVLPEIHHLSSIGDLRHTRDLATRSPEGEYRGWLWITA